MLSKKTFILVMMILMVPASYAQVLKFGMSVPLTGPAKFLGWQMKTGVETYFKRVNNMGGIYGNTLKLVALDDRYEPYLSQRNVSWLEADQELLAIVGNVGTPTAVVSVPIVNDKKILLFGTLSGAKILRNIPPDRYVINYRASYSQEAEVIIKALLDAGIKLNEIAFFTQNDSYGDAGYLGVVQALKDAGYSQDVINKIPHGRYTHNTTEIEAGLNTILKRREHLKVIIAIGAYKPIAKFIMQAKQYYPDAYYINVSFVGSEALLRELCKQNRKLCEEFSRNIVMTQVVPHYYSELPAAKDFIEDLHKAFPHADPSFVAFEGYLVAKLLVEGIKKAGPHPTRESIIDALESLSDVDIGIGFPLSLSKNKHQAVDKVWLATFKNLNSQVTIISIPALKLRSK